ncbi:MAG: AAA family ATPase [Candidatus Hadarchaeum sp.]|uniref:AAA family ATPase n=1 Tax=Candidatus Hadarchaeum sp. TaxID=2883567 RepID=UPI003D11A2C5
MKFNRMIVMFCGPPGSGKTEIARKLAERLSGSKIISTANFKRRVCRHMFSEAEKHARSVKYLILDGTFYRQEWRDGIEEIAKRKGQEVITVYLKCSLETCLRRNEARKNRIAERSVRIVYSQMEAPESPDIVIDTDILGVEAAVDVVLKFLASRPSFSPSEVVIHGN